MTCTGVAYSNYGLASPRVIQSWPGKPAEANNKVPSSLVYYSGVNWKVRAWDFASQNVPGTKEWFKRSLDPAKHATLMETLRRHPDQATNSARDAGPFNSPSHDDIKRYYKDYMQCLYNHLSDHIQGKTGSWQAKRVEFIFSLPCTFREPAIARTLLALVEEAGFGKGGSRHTIVAGLTEPEAAAVFTIKESAITFRAGTTILVCDAGGGTTDLAILENVTKEESELELESLSIVEGKSIGSTDIDVAFERLVEDRLATVTPALPENTAWSMMHSSQFMFYKCAFGQDECRHLRFSVPVPYVTGDFNYPKAGIVFGRMEFSE
ncbi:MAG: hypothetical protein Q9195_009260 [Heterodermia aff. obscurata]